MSNAAKLAVALGLLCALLIGVLVGGETRRPSEADRYYERANRALDEVAPSSVALTQTTEQRSEKDDLLASAKEIGTAAMICAGDSDDVLPGPSDFAKKVRPYYSGVNKGRDRLDDFAWTFAGGESMKVSAPAYTELGRLAGKSGDAVAYVDGHVKWQPK